ncbi:Conserved oligomeric Golgi complex subunit 5 [Geodia barretti]|uniref:Conserved oligomeric Golgi complex subunit 5 n=1 Tax=Geodia barretti TaxID=519541 RepID=A0AA35RMN8_GEOBA|nr:Conserved oligomeric Golgi complex subunit 5 [Geodia barretti]
MYFDLWSTYTPQGTMAQMCSVVSLFVGEVQRVMEEIVVSMHQENFGSELMAVSGTPDQPCSGYLRELQAFTARIHSQHLSLYHCTAEVEKQLREVSERVLELFVRHVCLLRPLREGGKMRVTTDMAQIELALTPFCSRPGELGRPYLMLRTLRRLLFQETDLALSETSGLGNQLPFSYALHHLFSRAPPDMTSPHQLKGWTEKAYSDWMDKQTIERDRLAFIQATLDAYSKRKRGQARSQYAEVYPVMVSLLKRGLEVGREGEGERGK